LLGVWPTSRAPRKASSKRCCVSGSENTSTLSAMSKPPEKPKAKRPPRPTAILQTTISAGGVGYRDPTDQEFEDAFKPYAEEMGKLAFHWNRLHVHLGDVFHLAAGIEDRDIARAIWSSQTSDHAQRQMLRAAAKRLGEDSFVYEEIIWIIDTIDNGHNNKRNITLHGPLDTITVITEGLEKTVISSDATSGNRYAKSVSDKEDLLAEFVRYAEYTKRLSDHARQLAGYIRWFDTLPDMPFPDRPVLPSTDQNPPQKGKTPHQRKPKES
jgi:hypothetical protein